MVWKFTHCNFIKLFSLYYNIFLMHQCIVYTKKQLLGYVVFFKSFTLLCFQKVIKKEGKVSSL